ncbi:MAG: hypothetical protein Q9180_009181, partial [Flavoplaca navasiana]
QPSGQIEICQDFGNLRNYIEDLEDTSGDYGPPLEPEQCRRFRKKRKNEVRGRCSSCETFIQSQLYPGEDIELQDFPPQEEAAASDSGSLSDDEQSVDPTRRSSVIHNPLQRPHTAHLSEDARLTYVREVVQTDIPDPFAIWQAHAASRGSAADRTRAADEASTSIMVDEVSRLVEARRTMAPPAPPVAPTNQTRVADETRTRELIEDVSRCAGLVGLPPYAPDRYTMHQRIIIVRAGNIINAYTQFYRHNPHLAQTQRPDPSRTWLDILGRQRALQRDIPPWLRLSLYQDLDDVVPARTQVERERERRIADEVIRLQREFERADRDREQRIADRAILARNFGARLV